MKSSLKRLSKSQVFSLIGLTISFVLVLCNVYNTNNLFWIFVGINLFSFTTFTTKWGNEGKTWLKKMDKKYDKNLTRKPSETLFFMMVAYYILVCLVLVGDFFFKNFMNESIIAIYVIAVLCNFIGLLIVNKTFKEVVSFVETSGKGKK